MVGLSRRILLLALLASASACSVADNLSYAEIRGELDRIVEVRGSGISRSLRYADRAEVSTWYMRSVFLVPIRQLLGFAFGKTSMQDLDNPSGHVRVLLQELPDEVGRDLAAGSDAIARLLWIAELDLSPGNRIVALDAATAVLLQLGIVGLADPERFGVLTDAGRLEAARAVVARSRPERRDSRVWNAEFRARYGEAIDLLAEQPLGDWSDRIGLIGDLLQLWQAETDAALVPAVAQSLRRALAHATHGALLRAVQSRDAKSADVRLCAMQQLRRLGGPAAVPFLLAVMAGPAATATDIADRFDRDPLVRLRLIHLCGQLRGDAALQSVQLPGRESWDTIAPADFLAQTVLTERAYYSKLRIPALTALTLCLGRPRLDYEADWVERWYRDRQRRS